MNNPTIIDYTGQLSVSYFLLINLLYSSFLKNDLFFFIFFTEILNEALNIILKSIIKEPRPKNQIKFNGKIAQYYGMPSGHAQSATFNSVIFCYQINNIYAYIFSIIICIITFYQRYKYRRHTILQIFFGSITGLLFGYFCLNTFLPFMT